MWGELIAGVLAGATKAALLWMQGKEDDAKAMMLTTLDEAQAKKLAHESKHAERDADIRGTVTAPEPTERTGFVFDQERVINPTGSQK